MIRNTKNLVKSYLTSIHFKYGSLLKQTCNSTLQEHKIGMKQKTEHGQSILYFAVKYFFHNKTFKKYILTQELYWFIISFYT